MSSFSSLCYFNSEEYHGGFRHTDVHPASDFGDPAEFGDVDPEVRKPSTEPGLQSSQLSLDEVQRGFLAPAILQYAIKDQLGHPKTQRDFALLLSGSLWHKDR